MSVGVMTKGSTAHGWSQNGNGYDSPRSDSDWPNIILAQVPSLDGLAQVAFFLSYFALRVYSKLVKVLIPLEKKRTF